VACGAGDVAPPGPCCPRSGGPAEFVPFGVEPGDEAEPGGKLDIVGLGDVAPPGPCWPRSGGPDEAAVFGVPPGDAIELGALPAPGPCCPRSTGLGEVLAVGFKPAAGADIRRCIEPCAISPDFEACAPIATALLRQTNLPCAALP